LDVISSIDIDLQEYGELLMQNRRGGIVALEPQTGEILALISVPNFDPSLLVGRVRSENFTSLQSDTTMPLFNRALMASYPPGSAFKIVNGLIGLQEEVITEDTRFGCNGGYMFVGCRFHASPLDLTSAIAISCNSYFCLAFRQILESRKFSNVEEGYTQWAKYISEFGFGRSLKTDFVNELAGIIPSSSYFDRLHGRNRWRALTVISLAIGQGELGTTPLQMANMTAAIANRGYYYTPHIVKGVGEVGKIDPRFGEKYYIDIDSIHFEKIVEGMEYAVNREGGTARVSAVPGIVMCGKTGTAQNPHGDNHSVFVAFAPKDDPKIAIAVFVENAGAGSAVAAPIASLMIEKYLTGTVTKNTRGQRVFGN